LRRTLVKLEHRQQRRGAKGRRRDAGVRRDGDVAQVRLFGEPHDDFDHFGLAGTAGTREELVGSIARRTKRRRDRFVRHAEVLGASAIGDDAVDPGADDALQPR